MKRIYLLRHAKSSWAGAGLSDHERPLAPRGLRAGPAMADHLRKHRVMVSVVLCSTARRTRDTLDLILPGLAGKPGIHYEDGLYQADADDLIARLKTLPDKVPSVMVIGHNPGLPETALALAGDGVPKRLRQLAEKFPTLGLADLSADIAHWKDLKPGAAQLLDLTVPADLAD